MSDERSIELEIEAPGKERWQLDDHRRTHEDYSVAGVRLRFCTVERTSAGEDLTYPLMRQAEEPADIPHRQSVGT